MLGPRLFSLYDNDLPNAITSSEVCLFADDSTFYFIGTNIGEVTDALNETGNQIATWCCKNKLTIHTGKSEVMSFTNEKFVGPLRPVNINKEEIKYVKTASCLGIMIDNHLRWDAQVKRVSKSLALKVSQLKRIRFLPVKVQEEIYFKTVIAAVTYSVTVWGTCPPALFNDFGKIHLRAARIIHQITSHSGKAQTMHVARWDSLGYIYKQRILAIIRKFQYETIPEAIQDHFKKGLSHSRDGCSFNLPRIRKEAGCTLVTFKGTLL